MKYLYNLREIFWPLLDDEDPERIELIKREDVKVSDEMLDFTLDQVIKIYQSEEERRASIETKSSLFIGTISVVISIIIGVNAFIGKYGELHPALAILSVMLIVYMCRTIWFSIQVLQRRNYNTLDFRDINLIASKAEYKRDLIVSITNKTRQNSIVINEKVDSMTMAQEYFKRALGSIVVYVLTQLGLQLFSNVTGFWKSIQNIILWISNTQINNWNIIAIFSLIAISLFLGIYSFYSLKKKNR